MLDKCLGKFLLLLLLLYVCVWQISKHMEIGKHPPTQLHLREGYVPEFRGGWRKRTELVMLRELHG